ncbi:Na+/H+ antiporter subunit D [soil metagenome]
MTIDQLPPLLVAVPLTGAAVMVLLRGQIRIQRAVSVLVSISLVVMSAMLLLEVHDGGVVLSRLGGWPKGLGIPLVADPLAAVMTVIASGTLLIVLLFGIGQFDDDQEIRLHPLYQVLAAGLLMVFLTGDLFNLFVAFEITLAASYVLLLLASGRDTIRPLITYVVINLVGSTLLLITIAFIYGATGTLDFNLLTTRLADLPDTVNTALRILLLVVFGIKAAIFPVFNAVPDSYPTAPTAITAVFAGLLTKMGVYAMIRTQAQVFGRAETGPDQLILILAALTMIVGVLGALAQDDIKRILSFHTISQVGFMVMGLGLFSVAGLAGAVVYIIHYIPTKVALFLVSGLVTKRTGGTSLARTHGLIGTAPVVAGLFAVFALGLSGIPPSSGFVAKLSLVQAGLDAGQGWVVAASLVASLLTMVSMTKVWSGSFLGEPTPPPGPAPSMVGYPLMTAVTFGVLGVTIAIAVAAGPVTRVSLVAAEHLLVPTGELLTDEMVVDDVPAADMLAEDEPTPEEGVQQ